MLMNHDNEDHMVGQHNICSDVWNTKYCTNIHGS